MTTPKTPLSITLYLILLIQFIGALEGGFVDYIYNFGVILMVLMFGLIQTALNNGKLTFRRQTKSASKSAVLLQSALARITQ